MMAKTQMGARKWFGLTESPIGAYTDSSLFRYGVRAYGTS